jgi:hypothetical protein
VEEDLPSSEDEEEGGRCLRGSKIIKK